MTDTRPPSVDSVVRRFDDGNLPRPLVVEAVREVIDLARQDPTLSIEDEVRSRLHRIRRSAPQRVVNATGVLLHTNLGRAPWSLAALNAAAEVATGYANVELDLETGERGRRNPTPERLLRLLTGAEAALGWTLDHVRERTAFGRPIGSFQNSRFVLAEMRTEIDVARAFVDRCVAALNAEELTATEAAEAKWWCTEMHKRVVDRCVQLHGGYGYMLEYPIARAYADTRITTIYGGTTEIMKEIIGKDLGL